MIKAIIFDCFGVLVEPTLEPFYEKYLHNEPELIKKASALNKAANIGTISYDEFVELMAGLAKITASEARSFLDNNPANVKLLSYIEDELKPKYKIGFLSNASDDWMQELFTSEQIKLFDDIILSYKVGMAKPDQAIFKLAASNLSVEPEECVFIDDLKHYCKGAELAGMKAILYHDFPTLKNDLKSILM